MIVRKSLNCTPTEYDNIADINPTVLANWDLVAQSDGTTTEYFAYDGLGSVRQVADASGDALLTQTYDPYGNLYARAGADVTSYGFTGEQEDSSGLLYLNTRK